MLEWLFFSHWANFVDILERILDKRNDLATSQIQEVYNLFGWILER